MRVYAVTIDMELLRFKTIKEFESQYSWIDYRLLSAYTYCHACVYFSEPLINPELTEKGSWRVSINELEHNLYRNEINPEGK